MTISGSNSESRTLKTVSTALRIMKVIKTDKGTRVSELADRFDISKSTAHAHLKTLEENGFVVQRGNRYELALELVSFGESVRSQNPLYRHGKSQADELADKTDQYTHIMMEENGWGMNIYQVKGETGVSGNYQTAKLHQHDYLHYTAAGKAILAYLPDDRVREIVEQRGLPAQTENTITDIETLLDALSTIRDRGWAYNDEEEIEGFRAIAAPVRNPDGEVLGSVSVSGPTSVLGGEQFRETIPEQVVRSANIIEVNINMNSRR